MTQDERVEFLLQQSCYIIDFLPEQVPENKHMVFDIEPYFLGSKEIQNFADKYTRIILKLLCYHSARIFYRQWFDHMEYIKLSQLIRGTVIKKKGFINLLFEDENTLLQIDGGSLCLTFYNPSAEIQRIASALAGSEGLFWRKGC